MISSVDFENIIASKKREIQKEKTTLGLQSSVDVVDLENDDKENVSEVTQKRVRFADPVLAGNNGGKEVKIRENEKRPAKEEDVISPHLERYIRRYLGLPVMLKTGEYSPNNPLVRAHNEHSRDVLFGLGEYEHRAKTLRRIRQLEYKQYLDEQAKKKQQERDLAKKERLESEARERERERLLSEHSEPALERERYIKTRVYERESYTDSRVLERDRNSKIDSAVQVDRGKPLSVGVQTDENGGNCLPKSPSINRLSPMHSQAEKELSPRLAIEPGTRKSTELTHTVYYEEEHKITPKQEDKPSYLPSILDADAIHLRNVRTQEENAKKRQSYQQELKDQIKEQQRIKEERMAREKMLEQAEMRRLEQQLDMLKLAQETENKRHEQITAAAKHNTKEFERKRHSIQKEIDLAQQSTLLKSITNRPTPLKRTIFTYPSENKNIIKKLKGTVEHPYLVNLPGDNLYENEQKNDKLTFPETLFDTKKYDVESYLRKNLNPSRDSLKINSAISSRNQNDRRYSFNPDYENNTIVEKALIHEPPKNYTKPDKTSFNVNETSIKPEKTGYEPSFLKRDTNKVTEIDLPIPVLRHSPTIQLNEVKSKDDGKSERMRIIEDKWKVPIVQKNILRSLPNGDGGNVSILTQLGSIRRQLQLEQLRLDNMLPKDESSI